MERRWAVNRVFDSVGDLIDLAVPKLLSLPKALRQQEIYHAKISRVTEWNDDGYWGEAAIRSLFRFLFTTGPKGLRIQTTGWFETCTIMMTFKMNELDMFNNFFVWHMVEETEHAPVCNNKLQKQSTFAWNVFGFFFLTLLDFGFPLVVLMVLIANEPWTLFTHPRNIVVDLLSFWYVMCYTIVHGIKLWIFHIPINEEEYVEFFKRQSRNVMNEKSRLLLQWRNLLIWITCKRKYKESIPKHIIND